MAEVIQIVVAGAPRPPVQVQQVVAAPPKVVRVVEPGPQGGPGPEGPEGPRGPSGAAGGVALEIAITTPSAQWVIPIPSEFTRRPEVSIYLNSGELVFADVTVTAQYVTVTFPTPTAGIAVLT